MLVSLDNARPGDFVRLKSGCREIVHRDGPWLYLDRLRVAHPGVVLTTVREPVAYEVTRLRSRGVEWAERGEG